MGVSRMRGFLAFLLVTAGAVFAKTAGKSATLALDCPMVKTRIIFAITGDVSTHQDPGQDALALDCPMLKTRIIGAQTEIWPDVKTWEECAIICEGVPACKFWTLSSMGHNSCYLWSSMTGQAEIPNNISGERGCLG